MNSLPEEFDANSPAPQGYDLALKKGRNGDPVVVTENPNVLSQLQAWSIPVLLADKNWNQSTAMMVEGWRLVFTPFDSYDFRQSIAKAVDTIAETELIDGIKEKNLVAFIQVGGNADSFEEHLHTARYYEYRDELEQSKKHGWSMPELMATEFPAIKWIVPDILPEGLALLSGAPKIGKSWFALDLAASVASGRPFLGEKTPSKGDVLYWALEDGPKRIQSRIAQISGLEGVFESLTVRTCELMPPELDQGGLELIENWYADAENPTLVIIDVLQKVRPAGKSGENEYTALYRGLKDLHRFTVETGLSVLVMHHNRKGGNSLDPFEDVAGSLAFTSLPDATLIMKRDTSGHAEAILYGRGRDLEEFDLAMDFENLRWVIQGDHASVRRSEQRNAVLECLGQQSEPMKPKEIASALGEPVNNISAILKKMVRASEVRKTGYGLYSLPPPK